MVLTPPPIPGAEIKSSTAVLGWRGVGKRRKGLSAVFFQTTNGLDVPREGVFRLLRPRGIDEVRSLGVDFGGGVTRVTGGHQIQSSNEGFVLHLVHHLYPV